jgi:curli biogenesis system outer membrane secretion channel CsgG
VIWRLLILAAFVECLAGSASGCNPQPTPQSDICDLAPGAPRPTVTGIEIGQTQNGEFMPIVEDSVVPLVIGGQGSDMVVAALRITGSGLGSCTAQITVLESETGETYSSEEAAIVTTHVASDIVVTGSILLPFYGSYGSRVRIRTSVSGTMDQVDFYAGDMFDVDAATDAPTDARPDVPIDAVVDAPLDAPPDA